MPKVSILSCSYNKALYVSDAINSVVGQTFKDFEYLIIENSTDDQTYKIVNLFVDSRIVVFQETLTPEARKEKYVESVLKNEYMKRVKGDYIMHLADDDYLQHDCIEKHLKHFEDNPGCRANYHAQKTVYINSDKPEQKRAAKIVFDKEHTPNCAIDGGTVMYESSLLNEIDYPFYPEEWETAHYSDGIFLEKIANIADICPISEILHTKRVTPISVHVTPDGPMYDKGYNPNA